MGERQVYKCMSCKYELKYVKGIGFMYSPDLLFSEQFGKPVVDSLIRSNKSKETLKERFNVRKAKICDGYGHALYVCPRCDETYNRFHIRLKDNGEFYEMGNKCANCKVKLIQLNDEESEKRIDLEVGRIFDRGCPKGGEKLLIEMMIER